jgi:hypothetical protein
VAKLVAYQATGRILSVHDLTGTLIGIGVMMMAAK